MHRIHQKALAEFDKIQSAVRDERLQALQDRRFYSIAGAQWEGPFGIQFENKPRLEINKTHLSVIRIINEYRNNRISATFHPKDGTKKDALANICAELFRADEQDSVAEEAYDNGFEEAVGGGIGAWRLCSAYEDEYDDENEYQRIRIEPIFDAESSVFFDLDAKRQDKADAKCCFVLSSMTRDRYRDEYDDDPATWPKVVYQRIFDWLTPDVVYVAEYYEIEEKREVIRIFQGLSGEEERYDSDDFEEDGELEANLAARGFKEVRQKKVKRKRVHKYIMSGNKIVEDCGYIAGSNIPIIVTYGKRWFIDNVERFMGHVRLSKDPQRLGNMLRTRLAEYAVVSALEKPIFTPEQVAGHQQMWADDNIKNYPFLLINQLTGPDGAPMAIGPQAYTKPPEIPPAMAALLQIAEQDLQDVLGNQQAAEEIRSNVSAKALELVGGRLDMQAYIYMSNMAKAIRRTGEVWLGMARELYIEEGRKMKGIGSQGNVTQVQLTTPIIDDEGVSDYENDMTQANFDIAVDVGPTSSSKRQSLIRTLTQIIPLTQDPETQQVMTSMVAHNLEGEGLNDFNEFFRKKLVMMGVSKPTEEDKKQAAEAAANQQPDPNAQLMAALAEQAVADAINKRADTIKKIQDANLSEVKAAEILAGIDISDREMLLKTLEALNNPQSGQGQMAEQ